jgi:hypothetical protein
VPPVGIPRVDPLTLTFDGVVVGFDLIRFVTVANGGPGPLLVAPPALAGPAAGEYRLDGGCAQVELGPGASCTIGVGFSPVALDLRDAALVVETRANEPIVVTLVGIGLPESPPDIDPTAFDFVTGPTVDVTVIATGPIIITDVALEGEWAASYAVNEANCEVTLAAAGIPCVVTADFIGDFVSCSSVQPADLVFRTFGGVPYTVHLQTSWIC